MLILSILWKWEGGIQWFLGILWYWGWYVLFFGHPVVLRGGINKIACFLVLLIIFNIIYSFFSLRFLWVICCPIQCRFPIFKFVSLQGDIFYFNCLTILLWNTYFLYILTSHKQTMTKLAKICWAGQHEWPMSIILSPAVTTLFYEA